MWPTDAKKTNKQKKKLTGENGAELRPAGDAALRGELAQRHLQEEDGQTSAKQEDEVRDEKGTCRADTTRDHKKTETAALFSSTHHV